MGFFFTQHAAETKRSGQRRGLRNAPATKQNAQTLNRLGCAACPLNNADVDTPKMKPTLGAKNGIYFLAEAPGQHEDETSGKPLTGPSGKLLRECIPSKELPYCSFDNTVRDRPPKNRTPTWTEIECCRGHVTKSIEEAKPKLIIGLGTITLSWALGSMDMSGMRGRVFAIKVGAHSCWFIPTYHPSFILRTAYNKDKPLHSKLGHCFKMDLRRAFTLLDELPPAKVDTEAEARAGVQCFDGTGGYDALMGLLKRASNAPIKAVDLETQGLRPFGKGAAILTAAVSFDDVNFSFALDHPKAQWRDREKMEIDDAFRALLKDDTKKVAHNAPFELEWLISYFSKNIVNHGAWECTMMQAHFLDERRGKQAQNDDNDSHRAIYQSLDFLCKQHFGIPYKKLFKLDKKNMANADLTETLTYNAVDTKYTLRLWHVQKALLKKDGLWSAYREALARQPTVALMQHLGIDVDQAEIKHNQHELKKEIKGILADIGDLKVVKAYRADHGEFNPMSGSDTITIFRDYLKMHREITVAVDKVLDYSRPSAAKQKVRDNTESGVKYSVDKNILDKIDHPLAELLIRLRNKTKLKSTYVDCFELGVGDYIWPDGLIHTSFNTTFAETGRTSCVASWTPIRTKSGLMPICLVQPGDYVWTHKNRWRKVIKLWKKGHAQMYDLYLSNGQVLTCTKKHRLLMSTGKWQPVGNLHGLFKEMDKESTKRDCSIESLPQQRIKNGEADSNNAGHTRKQCLVGNQKPFDQRGTQSVEDASLLTIKDRQQESNERQSVGSTPKMEGDLLRQQRALDNQNQNRPCICTPSSHKDNLRNSDYPTWLGSPSHRQRRGKQSPRQPSISYQTRASGDTHTATTGFSFIEVEEIKISGSYEVFDITVEEDSSYEACGVFSHNSDEPNMQNFPKRQDSWVRKQIIAPKNHILIAADYGQLEGCTAAMCSRDKVLVKALWEQYDIHREWMERLEKRYPLWLGSGESLDDKETAGKYRSIAKNKLVFPAIFGASTESIAGYLKIPEDVAEDLMDDFWGIFTGLKRWQDNLMKGYYDTGYVVSPTGRWHRYPLTRNQVINFPVQGVAADIVCDAMNALSQHAAQSGQWYLHPRLNIHDDLTFVVPDSKRVIDEAIKAIYEVMLTPTYDFINVPLSVSVSVGHNWYEMDEVGKFWSNKDV